MKAVRPKVAGDQIAPGAGTLILVLGARVYNSLVGTFAAYV